MTTRTAFRLIFPVALILTLGRVGVSQSVPTQVDPANLTGIMPYNTYGGTRENINLSTGDLNLRIPLVSLPGRNGFSFPLELVYDSKIWTYHYEFDPQGSTAWWDIEPFSSGWRFNIPVLSSSPVSGGPPLHPISCNGDFIVTLPDGSKHQFANTNLPYTGARTGCVQNAQQTPQYDINQYGTTDSSYLTIDISNLSDIIVYEKDGTRLHFSYPGVGAPIQAFRIDDANGNQIALPGLLKSMTDTLGRQITWTTTTGANPVTTIAYKDSSGTAQNIVLNYNTVTLNPTFVNPAGSNPGATSYSELASIVLPTGRTYAFQYDAGAYTYGELTKVTYPTGGYTRYDYSRFTALQLFPPYYYPAIDFREITAKHVCRDFGGSCTTSTEDTTTYSPTVDGTKTNNQYEDVTDPLGNLTHYQFSYATSSFTEAKISPRELNRSVYSGTSTLLRTVQTDYDGLLSDGSPSNGSRPIRKTTTLADVSPNLVTKIEWDYDTIANNVIAEREYDYGSGSAPTTPIRQTIRTFLHTNVVNGVDYTALPIHIFNRKLTENIQDNTGANFAQTQYEYDNYGTISASGAVQHNSAFGTGYTTRGNVTKAQVWRNTDGAWLATTKTFDDAGNVLSITAPSNAPYDTYTRTTTLSYADVWANGTCTPSGGNGAAYVTAVTNPLSQVTHYKYNSCTGAMASVTDPNSQTTNFTYDLEARLSQANFPDTGQISYCYSDLSTGSCYSTGQISMSRTDVITSGVNKVGKAYLDGIGNALQAQLASDPEGIDYTDITYDALGRKSTVSNPHRSTASSTDGTAQSTYDALGRVMVVTQPDGSHVNTSFSGNQTTVTDEAGKKRKSQTDGLGRLTTVWEDPTGVNYETDYQYDVLNNLTRVDQKGTAPTDSTQWRTRLFTYNSLSQLLTANNPESGTLNYAYDNEGNLITKTDARGITTNYSPTGNTIDALNRMTKITYSNGDTSVTYSYDAGTNGIGHRTGMTDASGSTSWTYDIMGHVASETITIGGVAKTISTTYNLDGSTNAITYPTGSGSVVAYTYNAAGHLTQVKDTVHNVTYLQSTSYAPPGELALATYGSVKETSIFNNRLQPCWYYATTGTQLAGSTACTGTATAANVLDLKYNFGLGSNDNSDVQSLTNDKDSNRSVSYTYDALNRIASAVTPNTDCSTLSSGITKNWGENFTIDAWGNLTNRTVTKCSAEPLGVVALTNNRLSGFGYDAAGNMTSNGSATYTYDGESRLKTAAGVTYTYDGDGNRVIKSNGTEYWGAGPLLESDGSGTFQREFIFAGGRRIARRDLPNGGLHYYFTDNLGSSDVVTTSTGTIQNQSDYYPYGGERVYNLVVTNQNYKFTGKERDSESGLDDFGARFNTSSLGRFMTPDWAARPTALPYAVYGDPQSLNLYGYVRNDPVSRVDADGHGPNDDWFGWRPGPGGAYDDGGEGLGQWLDGEPHLLTLGGVGGVTVQQMQDADKFAEQAMAQKQQQAQKGPKTDDPKNLVLVPHTDSGQDKTAYREVVYEVDKENGDPPDETWYVTEHQTNKSVAPPNGMSGGEKNQPNRFPDLIGCLGCRNVESQQTFFISRNPGLDAKPQFQIAVHVPKVGDFMQLGIHVDSGGNRINNNLHWSGVPFP